MSARAFERLRKTARGDLKIQSSFFARANRLFPRQDVIKCQTGLGRGDCVEAGSCRGFYETDRNLCPQGDGPREPWPCIGPNDVQCCVQNEDIDTGSSTSGPPSTMSSTTSSLPSTTPSIPSTTAKPPISNTATPTPPTPTNSQPLNPSSENLSSGAKGGIAGGVIAGVLIMGLIAALFFVLGKQRNAKRETSATSNARPPTATAAERRQEENVMTEKDDDTYGRPEFLGGIPLSELPADPLTGELDSQFHPHSPKSRRRQTARRIPASDQSSDDDFEVSEIWKESYQDLLNGN
ncbi:hypothetical protein ACJ73_04173 [Blastomyces percursus]|uniref:Uncharacterized protein n=1 Tax=Blastomyces percursus TaxID=1658174 RepID=A0A1J9R7J7_9EURO|nr:hypothetical protein ACJ73_04173 [Blastomyces percursus]